jgi:hypothetical protein
MKRISTFRLAFWSGIFAEIILCVSFVLCLGYGSSAPSHSNFLHLISIFHMPGLWLGAQLASIIGIFIVLPFMILSGVVQLTIIFWVSISLWRKFHKKPNPALAV